MPWGAGRPPPKAGFLSRHYLLEAALAVAAHPSRAYPARRQMFGMTTGKLSEAAGGFLDELFKCSSAVPNTLQRILNDVPLVPATAPRLA
jgi:hypothetical protein